MDKENGTAQETVEEIQIQQTEQHETMPESNETSNSEPNSREELNEEDIDNFLRNDEEGNTQIDKKHIPELGMKFKTDKEAHVLQLLRLFSWFFYCDNSSLQVNK